ILNQIKASSERKPVLALYLRFTPCSQQNYARLPPSVMYQGSSSNFAAVVSSLSESCRGGSFLVLQVQTCCGVKVGGSCALRLALKMINVKNRDGYYCYCVQE
ncbi:hypothetical protein XENOCAPTIV_023244, partial [Xenoophorus captivus]